MTKFVIKHENFGLGFVGLVLKMLITGKLYIIK